MGQNTIIGMRKARLLQPIF